MSHIDLINERITASVNGIESLRQQAGDIAGIGQAVIDCLQSGGTVYTCGNGGSAAEAMHLSEELIGRYRSNREPLRAICLNSDPSALTCIANDFGYSEIFARPCRALLTKADLLILFSTSGSSDNLIKAIDVAKSKGAQSIALLGRTGGACLSKSDASIVVRSSDSGHIQEAHQVILHIICEMVERAFTA